MVSIPATKVPSLIPLLPLREPHPLERCPVPQKPMIVTRSRSLSRTVNVSCKGVERSLRYRPVSYCFPEYGDYLRERGCTR